MTPETYKTIRLTLGLSRASLARQVGDTIEDIIGREKDTVEIDECAEYDLHRLQTTPPPPPRDARAPNGGAVFKPRP